MFQVIFEAHLDVGCECHDLVCTAYLWSKTSLLILFMILLKDNYLKQRWMVSFRIVFLYTWFEDNYDSVF